MKGKWLKSSYFSVFHLLLLELAQKEKKWSYFIFSRVFQLYTWVCKKVLFNHTLPRRIGCTVTEDHIKKKKKVLRCISFFCTALANSVSNPNWCKAPISSIFILLACTLDTQTRYTGEGNSGWGVIKSGPNSIMHDYPILIKVLRCIPLFCIAFADSVSNQN